MQALFCYIEHMPYSTGNLDVMKLRTFEEFMNGMINESPYLTDGKFTMKNLDDISISAIKRDYELLMKVSKPKEYLVIKNKTSSVPVIRVVEVIKDADRLPIIGQLEFKKKRISIDGFTECIQVDGVYFDEKIRDSGLASTIYQALVKIGFTVVSDSTQFPPGAGIWKKLAKESHKIGLSVFVYNTDTKKFILDANGKKISYNGSNIKDNEIWTNGWNFDGEKILMVLTK